MVYEVVVCIVNLLVCSKISNAVLIHVLYKSCACNIVTRFCFMFSCLFTINYSLLLSLPLSLHPLSLPPPPPPLFRFPLLFFPFIVAMTSSRQSPGQLGYDPNLIEIKSKVVLQFSPVNSSSFM